MIRPYGNFNPRVHHTAYIDISAQVIGDVHLGEHSSIWMNAVVRGDVHSIRIGERTNIQDCAVLHGMRGLHPVTIGAGVTIGHNATVHGCTVEDDVLIGMGAIILNGAVVGKDCIIAAGALVPEGMIVPPRSLFAGLPGKVRRAVTEVEAESIRTYANNYVHYKATYLAEDPT